MTQPQDKESVLEIFKLLEDHNRLAKKTSDLLETVLTDIQHQREQAERLTYLETRLEAVRKDVDTSISRCTQCAADFSTRLADFDRRREENKDKIAELSLAIVSSTNTAKDLINDKIEKLRSEYGSKFEAIVRDVSTTAGKYGAITAVVLSLLMMLVQWVVSHPVAKTP